MFVFFNGLHWPHIFTQNKLNYHPYSHIILPTINRDLVKKDVIWIFMDVYPESWVVELQPLVCGVVPRRRPVTSRFAGEQFVNVSGYFTNW